MVKGMADIEGDAKRDINSIARSRGQAVAAWVGATFFVFAVLTSWIPLLTGLANEIYTVGVVAPDAIFVCLAVAIVARHDPAGAHKVKNFALAGMTLGLLVFIGGAI